MFEKGKRERRHEQEDATFNRMLFWLAGAVVVELLFLLIKPVYLDLVITLSKGIWVFCFLGAALTAAGLVWVVLSFRKGKSMLVPCICASVVAGLWVTAVVSYFLFPDGLDIIMLLPAVGAVLIVVYFLYQRIFFLNALMTVGGLLVMWMHRQFFMHHPTVIRLIFAAALVLLAAGLALSFLLRRGDGKLGGLRIMPPDTSYLMTWITCGVTALALVLTLVLGMTAGFYLLFVLVAWVFIQAVFYTVQLM